VQVGEVGDLVGQQAAAAARVVGPAEHAGLEEGAVDDQLLTALEQIEQACLALRPVERVALLHRQPRHPPTLRGRRIPSLGQSRLLHQHLLAGRLHSCGNTGGVLVPAERRLAVSLGICSPPLDFGGVIGEVLIVWAPRCIENRWRAGRPAAAVDGAR
jgi:hypothetical protein